MPTWRLCSTLNSTLKISGTSELFVKQLQPTFGAVQSFFPKSVLLRQTAAGVPSTQGMYG